MVGAWCVRTCVDLLLRGRGRENLVELEGFVAVHLLVPDADPPVRRRTELARLAVAALAVGDDRPRTADDANVPSELDDDVVQPLALTDLALVRLQRDLRTRQLLDLAVQALKLGGCGRTPAVKCLLDLAPLRRRRVAERAVQLLQRTQGGADSRKSALEPLPRLAVLHTTCASRSQLGLQLRDLRASESLGGAEQLLEPRAFGLQR
jgi:hypothetical protein